MKERFIMAYRWAFGCSRKEANAAYLNADDERRRLIIETFEGNARKSFMDD